MSLRILLATLALLVATPAAAYEPDHFYVIRSKLDGRVLTAEGNASHLSGQILVPTGVAMRAPNNSPAQLWYIDRAPGVYGAMGMVYIRNYLGGRVLDIDGGQTNAITYAKKDTTDWNQFWRIDGNRILSYRATNHWQCLDVLYANWRYGPNTGRWNCHGGTNQQWEWVRKERIVRMGDVPGRITIVPTFGLMFARPLTPEEASAGGIYSWPFPGDARTKSYALLTWTNSKTACERLVANGTPNWRLPTQYEFITLLHMYKAPGSAPSGATLERLGWVNGTHWTSHKVDNDWYGAIQPNDPTREMTWPDHPFLAACVR
jgi:hypothetical protein